MVVPALVELLVKLNCLGDLVHGGHCQTRRCSWPILWIDRPSRCNHGLVKAMSMSHELRSLNKVIVSRGFPEGCGQLNGS